MRAKSILARFRAPFKYVGIPAENAGVCVSTSESLNLALKCEQIIVNATHNTFESAERYLCLAEKSEMLEPHHIYSLRHSLKRKRAQLAQEGR